MAQIGPFDSSDQQLPLADNVCDLIGDALRKTAVEPSFSTVSDIASQFVNFKMVLLFQMNQRGSVATLSLTNFDPSKYGQNLSFKDGYLPDFPIENSQFSGHHKAPSTLQFL